MSENWSIRPASHITLLSRVVDLSQGDILEIGTGYFSTLFLHWMAHIYKRNVCSYENDPKWYARSLRATSKYHKIIFVNNWDELPVDRHWGIVFIDHKPGERRSVDIKRFANSADYIVIHDTEPEHEKEYQLSKIWHLFKYRYDYKKIVPWTTVVSNSKELDNIE